MHCGLYLANYLAWIHTVFLAETSGQFNSSGPQSFHLGHELV